jgi:hypothetical protein
MKLVTVYIDPGDAAEAGKHQHQSHLYAMVQAK